MPGFLFFQYFDFDEPGFNGAIRAPCSLASSAIFLPSLKSFYKRRSSTVFHGCPCFPFWARPLTSLNAKYSDQSNRIKTFRHHEAIGNTWNSGTAGSRYKEDFSYDGNGNIDTLKRANQNGVAMDFLRYQYERNLKTGRLKTNRLRQVLDEVAGSTGDFDLAAGQIDGNYRYDLIGNMIGDDQSRINNIDWSVYGKIRQIAKSDNDNIAYSYDPSGNRVSKTTNTLNTYYVRDAQGNNLAVYDNEGGTLHWQEQSLYGSSRLGMWRPNLNLADGNASADWGTYGKKFFELSNHLGNVMAVINDKQVPANGSYDPEVINSTDYYAFGGQMPGRSSNLGNTSYRYGFNGKENDNEVKGTGNQQDYGMRIYDPRIAKFLSVDPISDQYPSLTPYQFASNRSIDGIDIDGKEYGTIHVNVNALTGENTANYYPYDPTNLHLYGPKGKGVSYDITRYTKNPNGKITVLNNYQIFTERNAKAVGLVPTEYGNYYGATGLFEVSKAFGNTNVPSYAASPIDAVDYAAMKHDIGYDKLNAAGPNSLFNDWGTTPVDESALNSWNSFLDKYKKGDTDPFSKQKVTSDETGAAWRGAKLFGGIVDAKKADISAFIRANHPDIAYKGPMSNRMNAKQLKAMNDYNYGQFLKIYMIKDKDGSYRRTPGKWTQDKNGDWKPKAK